MHIYKAKNILFIIVITLFLYGLPQQVRASEVDWAIVGAGPAGIVTVGLLLDLGVDPQKIAWIDPEFNVGRLGEYYATVPGNTKTRLFISFIQACKTFLACNSPAIDALFAYDQDKAYPLQIIVDPLRDITEYMCKQIRAYRNTMGSLNFVDDLWHIGLGDNVLRAQHVVLASGSRPRSLDYDCKQEIPLDQALNASELAAQVRPEDGIAVVGSSHSAVLILKFLSELSVKRIINFYNKPLEYAVDMGTWTLHNSTGLKGIAAEWARNVLEKNPPAHLIRIFNRPEALKAWLPVCNKIIYAIGYERNPLPAINGDTHLMYDDSSGIIAPRLFGIGIAFPEQYTDPLGNVEHRIGLNSFMEYAQRVIPEWMIDKSLINRFMLFDELFDIDIL